MLKSGRFCKCIGNTLESNFHYKRIGHAQVWADFDVHMRSINKQFECNFTGYAQVWGDSEVHRISIGM